MWTLFDQVRNTDIFRTLMEVNYLGGRPLHPSRPGALERAPRHDRGHLLRPRPGRRAVSQRVHCQQARLGRSPGDAADRVARGSPDSERDAGMDPEHRYPSSRPVRRRDTSGLRCTPVPPPARGERSRVLPTNHQLVIRTRGNLYIPKAMGFLPLVKLLFPSLLRRRPASRPETDRRGAEPFLSKREFPARTATAIGPPARFRSPGQ